MFTTLIVSALLLQVPQLSPTNVKEVVAAMTLEEKVSLIVGGGTSSYDGKDPKNGCVLDAVGATTAIPRLGIPSITFDDGPAGVTDSKGNYPLFRFPSSTLLAATWDLDAVRAIGSAVGEEAAGYGIEVMLAPAANIQRNPLCGRNYEYFSEDPVLSGSMAAAYINGMQSQGIGCALKHFVANNQELNRHANDSRVEERTLREIYLRDFEIALTLSDPWIVMTSYNYLNGVCVPENRDLLTTVLRDEWGYGGMVMTDWGAGGNGARMVAAGDDMIMPGGDKFREDVMSAVKDGSLPMELLDRSVTRILEMIARTSGITGKEPVYDIDADRHMALGRSVAADGAVLLKNEDGTLPLSKGEEVAVFGVDSYDYVVGSLPVHDLNYMHPLSLVSALRENGVPLNGEVDKFYEGYMEREHRRIERMNGEMQGYFVPERPVGLNPHELMRSAVKTSKTAIITFSKLSSQGKDRYLYSDYGLNRYQIAYLRELSGVFHAWGGKVVVVLNVCGPVEMDPWQQYADAVLVSWLGGDESTSAVADVLDGTVNPSGRLPMSFPSKYRFEPTSENFPVVLEDKPVDYHNYRYFEDVKVNEIKNIDFTNYEEGLKMGYRYFVSHRRKVAYPFGFGLSYSRFRYENVRTRRDGDEFVISLRLHNVGVYPGRDVVQVYVRGKGAGRPRRELKGFAKTEMIGSGKWGSVEIRIPVKLLEVYDEESSSWVLRKGRYTFQVGTDSQHIVAVRKARISKRVSRKVHDLFNVDGDLFLK